MATHIQGITNAPPLARNGKARTADSGQQKRSDKSASADVSTDTAHTVDLSPESISKAQKIISGSGYIASAEPGDIELDDEQALALSAEIAGQIENFSGGLIQPPSVELAGMVG